MDPRFVVLGDFKNSMARVFNEIIMDEQKTPEISMATGICDSTPDSYNCDSLNLLVGIYLIR